MAADPNAEVVPHASVVALRASTAKPSIVSSATFDQNEENIVRLWAKLLVSLDHDKLVETYGDGYEGKVAAMYAPVSNTSLPALWSPMLGFSSASNVSTTTDGVTTKTEHAVELALARLRADTTYDVTVYVRIKDDDSSESDAEAVWKGTFHSLTSGYPRFDMGAFVGIEGETPSFQMATFAIMGDRVMKTVDKDFYGLVAIDAEGYVVWYYHMLFLEAWDFLPDSHDLVLQSENSGNMFGDKPGLAWKGTTTEDNGRTRHWAGNSQLHQISPLGELREQYLQSCTGKPLNYNQISHECRVDTGDGGASDVLTTMYNVRHFDKVSAGTVTASGTDWTDYDTVVGQKVVKWNRDTNKISTVYDMFDLASPEKDMFESAAWTPTTAKCSGDDELTALDYHHISSVSLGLKDNYIVASRNLDTIWSLRRDGSGAEWTLSSSLDNSTDFAWDKELEIGRAHV